MNLRNLNYFIRHQAWAPMFDLKRSMVKIDALANGRDPRRDDDIFVQNWGKLYLTYETYSYGFLTDKIKVGEDEADKRVCRFCGRTGKEFFKNESHAIQEALGNRLLICNEECDVCNSELSESVEKHLYKFMEINRTLSNISGKGSKNHHLEGLNFHIHPDPATLAPIVYIKQEHIINDSYQGKPTGKIHLYNNGQISYQGIYKALLKIAIDLMPVDKMPHFTNTGRFVHGDFTATKLPSFSYGEHHAFYEQPVLDLFFRNDRSPRYAPYCTAVLRIFDSIIIFTVPFNDVDGDNYLTAEEVRENINLFKIQEYLYVHEWEDLDALDDTPRTPLYKLPLCAQNVPYRYEFRPSTDPIFEIKRDK